MRTLLDVDGLVALLAGDIETHGGPQVVNLVALLLLFDPQRAHVLVGIPFPGALDFRVSRLVGPLMKEAIQVAPGRFFDGAGQVAGFHRPVCVPFDIQAQGAKEIRVADFVAKHVQNAPALLIEMAVEKVDGLLELAAHDGALVLARFIHVAVEIAEQIDVGLVATARVGAPDVLEIGGEALVEPGLGPFAAGHEVAPPLVGQLVRDQVVDVLVQGGALVEQCLDGERGGRGVLHAAEDEIRDEDLAVTPERIRHTDDLREEVDERGRGRKAPLQIGLAAFGTVVVHVDLGFLGAILDFDELAADQGDQIRRMWKIQGVVPLSLAVAEIAALSQIAVREHEQILGRRAQDLAGGLEQGRVDARKIKARVFVLSLRPALARPTRMCLVRSHEVEPARGRAVVVDGDGEGVAASARGFKVDAQALAVVVGGLGRHVLDGDGGEGHVHRVHLDRAQVIPSALQRERDLATQGARLQIRLEFEPHVRDGNGTVRSEMSLGAWRGEGSWHGLSEGTLTWNVRSG